MTRRDIIRNAALAAAAGSSTAASAQHVHEAVRAGQKGAGDSLAVVKPYAPKAFNSNEWLTLRRLCDLIIPADAKSVGALEAGAPEYIDVLAGNTPELAILFTGGLAWLDNQSRSRFQTGFAAAPPDQQKSLLDLIAYRQNDSAELGPGIRFFDLARRMAVDAFYTSSEGIKAVGFMGNKGMARFEVPAEAIESAVRRSGL